MAKQENVSSSSFQNTGALGIFPCTIFYRQKKKKTKNNQKPTKQPKSKLGAALEFDLCSPLFFFLSFFMLLAGKVLKIAFGKIVSIIVSLHFYSHFTKA